MNPFFNCNYLSRLLCRIWVSPRFHIVACYLSELRPFSDYHTQISTYSFNGPCTNLISGYLKLGYGIISKTTSFPIFLIHIIGFVMDRWGKHDWKCDLIESNSFQYLSGTYDKDILSSSLVQFATLNYLWNIICLLYTIFFFFDDHYGGMTLEYEFTQLWHWTNRTRLDTRGPRD